MKLTVQQIDVVTVVTVPGTHLVAANAQDFVREATPLLGEKAKVVFDMREVRFVDSTGLGSLLSCLRKLAQTGGELKLSHLTAPVRALFELVRMHQVFDVFNTTEEALQSLELHPAT